MSETLWCKTKSTVIRT